MTAVTEEVRPEPEPVPSRRPSRGRLALAVSVVVGVVVAFLVVVLASSPPATDRVAKSPLVGELAPAIAGRTVDGRAFDLGNFGGRWVLLNFFATWCTPCRQEHPELRQFNDEHTATGDAAVVSVVVEDDAATVKRFFAKQGGDWPVVIDPDSSVALEYGLIKVPESYLISPSGLVVAKVTGGVTAAGIDKVIADLQAQSPAVDPPTTTP